VANCVDFVVIEVIIAKKALVHSDPFGYYFVFWILVYKTIKLIHNIFFLN
jgi:hypothetical protein